MLDIYRVSLEMLREVRVVLEVLGQHDRDLAKQLRRSSTSVTLNIAEGSAVRDGRRRVRYGDALGSALEAKATLEAAVALGYLRQIPPKLPGQFNHIIGVLTKLTKPANP